MRSLSVGSTGPDVRALQQGLNLRRQPPDTALVEDGVFGPKTQTAVRRFQERNGLAADGVVGPRTRNAIFPLAVVSLRALGMRLRLPPLSLGSGRQNLSGGLGAAPAPSPFMLPPLAPALGGFQPISYPRLLQPLQSPLLPPPPSLPGIQIPVHHLELQPGTSVSLGTPVDVSFSLQLSAVVMLGPENGRHQEFSSGIITSTPGVFSGGDWTVAWFAQLTHVEQLNRAGNFSWQPNAQIAAGHGDRPFLSLTAAPANVQFDVNETISLSFGGPSVTATFAPAGASLSWGLASFGVVGKFN
jgi:hypothetical protein